MNVDEFDFDLPRELIADHPAHPRDSARLLRVTDRLTDCHIHDLPGLLRPADVLVVNDTKVIPARLTGRRGQVRIEITLIRALASGLWRAFAKPARRLKPGDRIDFADDFSASVEARDGATVDLQFDCAGERFDGALARHGAAPLPPYIKRPHGPERADRDDYQTVYAARPGAVAAPTAGLHFTEALLAKLAANGNPTIMLTLHVGPGTFRPVEVPDTADHCMDPEWGQVSAPAATAINNARAAGGRVVAVGSTALRLLEAAARDDGTVTPFEGETDLFITPGYRFKVADLMLTNFHLPRSTLFMLVAAFSGLDRMRAAYAHAMRAGYRFYSFGDACLLDRVP